MKRVILQITLMIVGSCAFAQLGTPMLQYYGNQMVSNPAYAGKHDALSATLSVRKQWFQIPGSPMLVSLNAHQPFKGSRHAWGGIIQNESHGALNHIVGYANYAYYLWLGKAELRLGLQAGLQNHTVNWGKIEHIKDDDDPFFGTRPSNRTNFNVNVGAIYTTFDYYVGLSIKHLTPPKFNFEKNRPSEKSWHPRSPTQFLLHGGTDFRVDRDWSIRPELFLHYTFTSPLSVNTGVQANYQNQYFFGVNFQTVQRSLAFSVRGFVLENLQASYSYGLFYNVLKSARYGGTHEISLIYRYKPTNPFTQPLRFFD